MKVLYIFPMIISTMAACQAHRIEPHHIDAKVQVNDTRQYDFDMPLNQYTKGLAKPYSYFKTHCVLDDPTLAKIRLLEGGLTHQNTIWFAIQIEGVRPGITQFRCGVTSKETDTQYQTAAAGTVRIVRQEHH